MPHQEFDNALIKAVDFAFQSLGNSSQHAFYYHLEKAAHIKKTEIPERIREFKSFMRHVFNDGAIFIERLILKELVKSLGVSINEEEFNDFLEAVSRIKAMSSKNQVAFLTSFEGDPAASRRISKEV